MKISSQTCIPHAKHMCMTQKYNLDSIWISNYENKLTNMHKSRMKFNIVKEMYIIDQRLFLSQTTMVQSRATKQIYTVLYKNMKLSLA
jgi:hypothetical protein